MNERKNHYWCNNCKIPLIGKICLYCGDPGEKIISELKPVFKYEYKFYKICAIEQEKIREPVFPKILYRYRNNLISDCSNGKIHYTIKVKGNKQSISKKYKDLMNPGEFEISLNVIYENTKRSRIRSFYLENRDYLEKLLTGNKIYLEEIEKEAINFIKDVSLRFPDYYKIVSFSGGKDSTVTAYLVQKAIGDIPIVFSDTGIEYPETINYVKKYGNFFGKLIFLDSEVDFLEMCKKLGPPSRT
ncbi:MAG: phosphoadenosine phosphosulfate reductase family protein, partial [Promethearchaeia archaeon]